MSKFTTTLRKLRFASGLTQNELGERAGIGRSLVGQYESGAREPAVSSLLALAKALGVSVSMLAGDEDYSRLEGPLAPQLALLWNGLSETDRQRLVDLADKLSALTHSGNC